MLTDFTPHTPKYSTARGEAKGDNEKQARSSASRGRDAEGGSTDAARKRSRPSCEGEQGGSRAGRLAERCRPPSRARQSGGCRGLAARAGSVRGARPAPLPTPSTERAREELPRQQLSGRGGGKGGRRRVAGHSPTVVVPLTACASSPHRQARQRAMRGSAGVRAMVAVMKRRVATPARRRFLSLRSRFLRAPSAHPPSAAAPPRPAPRVT